MPPRAQFSPLHILLIVFVLILWSRASYFLFNTYQGYARIFVKGVAQPVLSREGTTQGGPLAMLMYAVGVLPLVRKLKAGEVLCSDLVRR